MQLGIGPDIRRVRFWFTYRLPWRLLFPYCNSVFMMRLSGVSHRYLRQERALYLVPWFNFWNTFQRSPPPRIRTMAGMVSNGSAVMALALSLAKPWSRTSFPLYLPTLQSLSLLLYPPRSQCSPPLCDHTIPPHPPPILSLVFRVHTIIFKELILPTCLPLLTNFIY